MGRNIAQTCLLLQSLYALWVSPWTFVFSFWAKFLIFLFFNWHWIFFAPTCTTFARVSFIKSMKSLKKLYGPSPNVLWHSFVWITEDELARNAYTFSFSLKKNLFTEKGNSCKLIPQPCWNDDSEYLKDYECKATELQICPKWRQFPSFLVWKNGFCPEVGFFE